jgi:hypothetical protein
MTTKVAIMVPLSFRTERTADEEISYRHLLHYLGKYDKYLIVPKGTRVRWPGFEVLEFPQKYFGSVLNHTKLMLSERLYQSFSNYQFLMIYHLDALVFSYDLDKWCAAGFDYIGAPWFQNPDTPWVRRQSVGNGGFCLRNLNSVLNVLNSNRPCQDPTEYWREFSAGRSQMSRLMNGPRKYLKRLQWFNDVRWQLYRWSINEDHFWSTFAAHYYPEFRVADFQSALRFAFEAAPRRCFEMNDRRLPFGCHAWFRYDRQFWEPFLLDRS